ncbi:MAG: pyruvate, phosphate dikinase, partial [Acidobacteria bacterium]|nr:pyruvate, phosphate dikinase [Acidobacteriota bacterium]
KVDPALRADIVNRWKTQLGGKPVFVRSSSNSEDLPNFSGAGLYTSVANVRDEDKIIEAVKTVWASLWNFQGYEARVRNYVSQDDVYMSAFVQLGVDMEKGGVMITKDPFDDRAKDNVYISAVCGHNTKVTANDGVPEQVLFNPRSNSVVVMTLSQQKGALRFDTTSGDLKETTDVCAAGPKKRVLTDFQARSLARAAIAIRSAFPGRKEQDIEWGIIGNRIYIVQSRPYIDKK